MPCHAAMCNMLRRQRLNKALQPSQIWVIPERTFLRFFTENNLPILLLFGKKIILKYQNFLYMALHFCVLTAFYDVEFGMLRLRLRYHKHY